VSKGRCKEFVNYGVEWLQKAIVQHGAPQHLRIDSSLEFIANIVRRWLKAKDINSVR
jgi:hypothetical protein